MEEEAEEAEATEEAEEIEAEDVEEAEEEGEEKEHALGWALRGNNVQQKTNENSSTDAAAADTRWVLGTSSNSNTAVEGNAFAEAMEERREELQQTIASKIREAVTRRTGTRTKKPRKFFDELETSSKVATTTHDGVDDREYVKKVGENKRYASINVRTLAMQGDKNRKETCGKTAAAEEWVLEFVERGLGVVGLQECRVPNMMDGVEGEYRTFYSGNKEGQRRHGVGIYMHSAVTQGEFDIQPVNERIIWVYGSIYGTNQAVFSVYAPTNKKDNISEVDKFYTTLEQQIKVVRTKYGPETKIIILGDFNARIGTDGSDNMTEERNDDNEVCANGKFEFEETDDNGAELLTFCVAKHFKVMDSYLSE